MSASLPPPTPTLPLTDTVFNSGSLFISSKGLGWTTSWKKRWFILTRTSLVFFKNDPSALPQRGGQVNLTLGGIDLNSSGSVIVREDKKLLTVLFPDGRDGRAFTLKAETSDDLYKWKNALEKALAQASSAALVMGHNGIFRRNANDAAEGLFAQWRDRCAVKSLVVGRPILLALEDIDGGPSFLEKALQFLETFGNNVEGILRLCANAEEVEHRIQEYEQGKHAFSPDEDAHVVGDCVKHILRELPSSPVPASCCTALLDAYKIEMKEARITALRSAIVETFPKPNQRLLQRILQMMRMIASQSAENRMTSSAVATCMAPLLLRPLLAGECELDDCYDTNGDNCAQLLAAANAANSAAAIVTTLLEEYEIIFDDDTLQRCSISASSQIDNSESDYLTDDDMSVIVNNGYLDAENLGDRDSDDDHDRILSGKLSESSGSTGSDLYDYKISAAGVDDSVEFTGVNPASAGNSKRLLDSSKLRGSTSKLNAQVKQTTNANETSTNAIDIPITPNGESYKSTWEILSSMASGPPLTASSAASRAENSSSKVSGSSVGVKYSTFWGRSSVRKTLSLESDDSSVEEEFSIQKLAIAKEELHRRIAKEAQGNSILQASLERRKRSLHERRLALEQDVQILQEQLQAERDLRAALEAGLSMSTRKLSTSRNMDSKTRAELEEVARAVADVARLKQKVAELHHQLNQQRQHQSGPRSEVRTFQQDSNTTLAFCNDEITRRNEEGFLGPVWRNIKEQALAAIHSTRQPSRKQFTEQIKLLKRFKDP